MEQPEGSAQFDTQPFDSAPRRRPRQQPVLVVVGLLLVACVLSLGCTICGATGLWAARNGLLDLGPQALSPTEPADQRGTPPAAIARGGELRLYGDEPVTLDPALVGDSSSSTYIEEIFSGLVTLDADLRVAPDLAERWDISQDGRTYTFYLRSDATFQDGRPITAADFKYSLERACSPEMVAQAQAAPTYLGDIEGAAAVMQGEAKEISGLRVTDEHTLALTIDAPKAYFLAKLTYPTAFVVDRHNVAQGANWTDHPNGSGPFRLAQRDEQRIVLERNERFYGGAPKLQRVTFTILGGHPMTMYENDQLDMVEVGLYDVERVLDPSNPLSSELTVTDNLSFSYLGMDVHTPPFDDPKVRQAFAHAIDRKRLADVVLKKMVTPAQGVLPPGMSGYQAGLQGLEFDPDLALQRLRESGYKDAADLPEVVLHISGSGGTMPPMVDAITAMLRTNLGVEVTVEQTPVAVFFRDLEEHRYGFFLTGWIADYPDPQNFVDILFHSNSGHNYARYRNKQVDDLLEQARVEQDQEQRRQLYQQAEASIVQDAPCVPLWHDRSYSLAKPYVKGLVYSAAIRPWLKDVYLER
ncbi:MAG TPA: peptide ABC transporter substrate-binding protein [Anaerolineae bacterium]|nr:peptide ABC transporter substrate-binding protein [Anaerolineae bacterium]HPL29366.1 peptide ABC transporter substrate-binding protein [Anaerolineae bacterium]